MVLVWWRLVRRVGHRGAALLFFSLLDLIYAYSLFSPTPEDRRNPVLLYVASIAPLWFFAALWLIASILCGVNAFRFRDRAGFTAAIAVKVLWGCLFIGGMFAGLSRAYVSATLWLCLGAFVAVMASWPEPTWLGFDADAQRALDADAVAADGKGV